MFSLQILDEVEKRRAISPALVQPFMRGIMEAPFPAPGRTITVKNFLPGSGTEVWGLGNRGCRVLILVLVGVHVREGSEVSYR